MRYPLPGIHLGTACPVAQGIDFCFGVHGIDIIGICIALANDQPITAEDVLAVAEVFAIQRLCDTGQLPLFIGYGDTTENAIVTAAHLLHLVFGQDGILGNFMVGGENTVTRHSADDLANCFLIQLRGCLCDNVADAMAD